MNRLTATEQARLPALLVGLIGFAAATVAGSQVYSYPTPVLLLLVALLGLTFLPATLVLRPVGAHGGVATTGAVVVIAIAADIAVGIVHRAHGGHGANVALTFGVLLLPSAVYCILVRRRGGARHRRSPARQS